MQTAIYCRRGERELSLSEILGRAVYVLFCFLLNMI